MSSEATTTITACRACGHALHDNGIDRGCEGLSIGQVKTLLSLLVDPSLRRRGEAQRVLRKLERIAACGPADALPGDPVIFCRDCRTRLGEWGDFKDCAIFIGPGLAGQLGRLLQPGRGRPSGDVISERLSLFSELAGVYQHAVDVHVSLTVPGMDETDPDATERLS